jgi:hypothetical protein
MNTTRMAGTIQTVTASFLMAAAVVLFLGLMIPNVAAAKEFSKPAYTSIKTRVQGQSDLCWAGGGTTTVTTANGSSSTSCEGGKQDGMTCTNTSSMTSCDMPERRVLEGSKLAEVIAGSSLIGSEPAVAPEGENSGIDQGAVSEEAPAVAPEPTSTPEDAMGIDQGAVTEEAPEVAPEPTGTPEGDTTIIDDGALTDEPLAVDPGTEGDAPSSGKELNVDVVLGDGSALPALEIDEQQ